MDSVNRSVIVRVPITGGIVFTRGQSRRRCGKLQIGEEGQVEVTQPGGVLAEPTVQIGPGGAIGEIRGTLEPDPAKVGIAALDPLLGAKDGLNLGPVRLQQTVGGLSTLPCRFQVDTGVLVTRRVPEGEA